ncbi:MAG: hypothetical protein K2H09_07080 [Treponemataceae bacterium]|nr:hypothetical protein [Treponemataceae bacterium]
MIVRLYKAVMRTADATEESEALLRRMLKVQEAVAKREHPDLYASAASADASGADKTEPSEQQ